MTCRKKALFASRNKTKKHFNHNVFSERMLWIYHLTWTPLRQRWHDVGSWKAARYSWSWGSWVWCPHAPTAARTLWATITQYSRHCIPTTSSTTYMLHKNLNTPGRRSHTLTHYTDIHLLDHLTGKIQHHCHENWKKKRHWRCAYLVERNSISLFVFSSVSWGVSSRSSRSSGVTRGKFPTLPAVLPPPRLAEDELEVELRPESTTGDVCHSRRKSGVSKAAW